jgi:Ca-activated chloride channel family protein
MNFLHPEFLYYVMPLLFILFGFLLTQQEAQEEYFSKEVMERLRVRADTLTLQARNWLFFISGILIIIALSGPVINEGEVEIKAKSSDIMIALDISDSMLGEDLYPNRLKFAKQKMMDLLKIAPNERIGVVAFAKNSYLVSPLSFDHGAVSFLLDKLNTNSITEKGTDFYSLLKVVKNSIKSDGKKYLLLLSDGGDKSDFTQEIEYAKENNIVVFILGVGTKKGAPIKLSDGRFIKKNGEILISRLNENIATLATSTGGVYIESVNSKDDIKTMLQEIVSKSKKRELKSEKIERYIPLFYYPLGLALLILLIATSSMSKRKEVKMPVVLLLFSLLVNSGELKADLLDFMELEKAKKAYDSGEYEKSQKLYGEYAKRSRNAESFYNEANALYKMKRYKESRDRYQRAIFDSKERSAKKYANIGNSYVKEGAKGALQKAKEAYEKSLSLVEDKDTRENLEAVKKEIEREKKKKEKQKKKQKKKQNKNSKNSDKNKQDKKSNDKKDDKSKEDKKQDKKSNDKKDDKSKEDKKQDKKSNDKKDDKSKEDKKQDKKSNDKKDDKSKEDKKQDKKSNDKSKQDQKNSHDKNSTKSKQPKEELKELNKKQEAQSMQKVQKMSDAEESKWLKALNSKQNTYMYRLNSSKKTEERSDETPW